MRILFLPQGRGTSRPSGRLWVMRYAATHGGHDVHCLWPSGLRCPTTEGTRCRWIDVQEPYASCRSSPIDTPDLLNQPTVRAQFLSEWDSPKDEAPSLAKVYEIINPRDVRNQHERYRRVPRGGQIYQAETGLTSKHRSSYPAFEEVRSFHSSQCICDLGHKEPILCNFKSCGICLIVKSSFKSFAFGASSNSGRCAESCWLKMMKCWWWSRFGDGIYSYRNPAFADQYATSCTSSPYRVMIACDALVEPADEVRLFALLFFEQKSSKKSFSPLRKSHFSFQVQTPSCPYTSSYILNRVRESIKERAFNNSNPCHFINDKK